MTRSSVSSRRREGRSEIGDATLARARSDFFPTEGDEEVKDSESMLKDKHERAKKIDSIVFKA